MVSMWGRRLLKEYDAFRCAMWYGGDVSVAIYIFVETN